MAHGLGIEPKIAAARRVLLICRVYTLTVNKIILAYAALSGTSTPFSKCVNQTLKMVEG